MSGVVCLLKDAVIGSRAAEVLEACSQGQLAARFHDSCYLETDSGEYLLLCDRRYGALSFAIGLPDPQEFLALGLFAGARFRAAPRKLHFPGVTVLISGCVRPPGSPVFPSRALCRSGIPRLTAYLHSTDRGAARDLLVLLPGLDIGDLTPPETFGGNPFAAAARKPVCRLLRACLQNGDEQELSKCLQGLLGLGSGLTPSMDDWLLGFLYTLQRSSACPSVSGKLSRLIPALSPGRTSFASVAYLRAVSRGESFELLDRVLSALAEGNAPDIDAAASALMKVGSGSGSDILTGMVFALNTSIIL